MPGDATPSKSPWTGKTRRPGGSPKRRGHGPDVPLHGLAALRRDFVRSDERLTRPVAGRESGLMERPRRQVRRKQCARPC